MVIIFVRMKVRPEKHKELTQTLQSIVEKVKRESGCLNIGFYQNTDDQNNLLVVEEWATQKESDDHMGSDIFAVLLGAGSLMIQPPEIEIYTADFSRQQEK